jgi:RimJ/RimL family protein N-acetyltransferase
LEAAGAAMIRLAPLEMTDAERAVASVDEPNQASVRVLERLGMLRTRRSMVNGRPLLHYALARERA